MSENSPISGPKMDPYTFAITAIPHNQAIFQTLATRQTFPDNNTQYFSTEYDRPSIFRVKKMITYIHEQTAILINFRIVIWNHKL